MLTGERRGSSARRGMQVLGKIPAVPKPINLPSQRLENRGLDPNVEIVPRGSVSWGSVGRSPPTTNSAWGNPPPASSPPISSGAWGAKSGTAPAGTSAGVGGPANLPRPTSGGSGARPTSGGSGTRPSSAGSIGQSQQSPDSFSSTANSNSAWGARPASASGVLGQAHQTSVPLSRPRSADTSRSLSNLSQSGESANPSPPAWGGSGAPRRLGEEPHQVSRFQLTRTDFPTLGSEKNPDLRPQQGTSVPEQGGSVEEKVPPSEETWSHAPPGPHEEVLPTPPAENYGIQDRGAMDSWRREPAPFQGPPPISEGNWHREGPPPRPLHGGQLSQGDNWRRDAPPLGGPADDSWRRGGAPPVGQYGPPPGPGHFPHDGPGFMHQPRFGLGPAPYGRGVPGPGGYGHHGDMYGNAGPLLRPAGPMHPLRPNMYQGPVPYDGFYGPQNYQGMEEPERMMLGMGVGPYGGYPPHRGPPPEAFGRYPHVGMNQGPRHPLNNNVRDRNDAVEGYHEGPNFHKEGPGHKEGRGYSERFTGGPSPSQDTGDNRRGAAIQSANPGTDSHRQSHRGGSSGHHVGHRDWGASDEPMDFSKPVFEEEISLPASDTSGKQSPAPPQIEVIADEEVKHEDTIKLDWKNDKNIIDLEVLKDEEQAKVTVGLKSETVPSLRLEQGVSSPIIKINDAIESPEGRDQIERKVINVVDKEVMAKVVTKETSGKWERGSRRAENNNNREVIGPVAASVHPSRSGHQKATKPGILGNAPRIATSELLPLPEVSHPPSQDKFAAVPSPPASETESQKASEKPRNVRRSGVSGVDSPRSEPVVADSAASNTAGVQTPAAHDSVGKDGTKAKAKASSHDGEKEWRPKVSLVESSTRPLATAPAPVIKPVVAQATPVPTDSTDNSALDTESSLQPDSYDFDAQRAKMKESAAQRARQLQKEEEERIKEQKAKARAKLEELDRRGRAHVSINDEPLVETVKTMHEDDIATLEQSLPLDTEPVAETGLSSSTSRVSGRNEHGKRERDRKANGRKTAVAVAVAVAESTKGKVNGTVAQPTAILPAPAVTAAPLLSTPVAQPELHGQQVKAQQQPRSHRGSRPEKKQIVARLDDVDQVNFPVFADNGGWNIGASTSQDTDVVDHASQVTMSSISRKKTSSKRSNRKNLKEVALEGPISGEGIQFGDIIAELHTNGSSGSDIPVDSNLSLLRVDSGKDTSLFNVNLSGDALTGDEESAVSTNGDLPSKRLSRKGHSARRPSRGDRGSQDVRVADKSHSNDSMVWAPVRSPQAGGGSKAESVDTQTSEQPKDESSAVQQSAQAPVKRVELERYSPKPVLKHLEAVEARVPSSQRYNQTSLNTNTQAAPPSPANSAEATRVPEAKQASSVDSKSNHDTKQADPVSKRPHGAWRQRSSGSDRGSENVKDLSSASHPSGFAHGETGNQSARPDQKSGGHPPFRRNQGPGNQLLAALQASQITSPSNPAPSRGLPAPTPTQVSVPDLVHAPEREQPAHQKPYQAPRPTSAPAQRGQDQQGQNPRFSKNKGHEQGSVQHSRNFGAPTDGSFPSENSGPHQPNRTGSSNHPRQQVSEREQAPNQQVFAGSHSQNKSVTAPAHKEPGQPMPRERHHQQQQSSRGDYQQSSDSNEHGSHQRGRFEGEHEMRPSGAPQRGQGHWQQTAAHDGYRGASSRTQASERDLPISQSGRNESKKQEAADSQGSQQSSGQHQSKTSQQTAPMAIPSPKVESGHWTGEGGSPPVSRGRDFNHGRRGRYGGGRTGPRNTEVEHRRDPPVTKQRLVIDATGGAVPSQVAG